jgi:hypothetical protein
MEIGVCLDASHVNSPVGVVRVFLGNFSIQITPELEHADKGCANVNPPPPQPIRHSRNGDYPGVVHAGIDSKCAAPSK